ncbi:subunit of TIM23 translocase complex [Physocladia obscura]|uniref:Subunit of TIM23 translocase complex n=1 Tax=Physocladia obscura TaxID=109957 RepID=A0AAD5SVW5_9FUNG|nr:subunit of TIM23 translocase complex [Physocladia obscura]
MKMGFLMGGITGGCLGFLVGGMNVLRYGPGEKGYLATVGNQMLQTGGFLGFIMGIGMLVRNEAADTLLPPPTTPAASPFSFSSKSRPIAAILYGQNRLPIVVESLNIRK